MNTFVKAIALLSFRSVVDLFPFTSLWFNALSLLLLLQEGPVTRSTGYPCAISPIPRDIAQLCVGARLYVVVSDFIAIPSYELSHISAFAQMADIVVDRVFTVDFRNFMAPVWRLLIASCLTCSVVRVIHVALRSWASPISMGQSVAEESPGRYSGYWDCCEAFELFEKVVNGFGMGRGRKGSVADFLVCPPDDGFCVLPCSRKRVTSSKCTKLRSCLSFLWLMTWLLSMRGHVWEFFDRLHSGNRKPFDVIMLPWFCKFIWW